MAEVDWRADREEAARNLLAHLGEDPAYVWNEQHRRVLRWIPGTFVSKLIDLLLVSDSLNRALLAIGFPAYVWAVTQYKDEADGLEALAQVAGWTEGG
jgi:hypothetical protein